MSESLPVTTTTNAVIGRPTKYLPEYCDAVLVLGMEGHCSYAQVAASFGVDKATVINWSRTYPDFLTSLNRARASAEAYWERTYSDAALNNGNKLAQGYACFDMKNRFGWTDQRDVKHSGQVNHQHTAAGQAFAAHVKELKDSKDDAIDVEYTVLDQ